jgi:CubicO group peptidase (beta-lactamase class C family)
MKRSLLISTAIYLLLQTALLSAQESQAVAPEELGFISQRLDKLHAMVQGYIDQGKHAGAISAIARNGVVVDLKTYGCRDLEAKKPMELDTIFRVYSMSKVITSVAVMQLVEEAKIKLDDPIETYLPELKGLKVITGGTADSPTLVPATNAITVKHLLTHTAGFVYDFSAKEPLKQLYQKADLLEAASTSDFIKRLATLPLAHQPGTAYAYGVNTDVLGRLVEVVSGLSLEEYVQKNICEPIGMKDTSFDVPEEKMPRLAKLYETGPDGKLKALEKPIYGAYAEKGKGFASGGAGIFSTISDYFCFAQMLLNGGRFNDQQVLGKKTVELMMVNHLTFLDKPFLDSNQSTGFGLGGSVRLDLAKANRLGSVGQFGWSGAATTTFNIDPEEKTVVLLMIQHTPYDQYGIFDKFYTLFYQAMAE